MEFAQIKETCLYVSDLDATESFYRGKLGMPMISKVAGRHVFFQAGTSVLLCFIASETRKEPVLPPHYAVGKQHIAFEVTPDQYEEIKLQLEQSGVKVTHEQEWNQGVKSFYFDDPDGHVLEVVPQGMWD